VFYNPATDTGTPPTTATDLYIRSMTITGPALSGVAGDYNKDGSVNAADYVVWRNHLGQIFQLDNEVSDITPGMVTPHDYDAWQARFGDNSGSGTGGDMAVAAVPEPIALSNAPAAIVGIIVVAARHWWPARSQRATVKAPTWRDGRR
jgi:hypothetical protein